MCFNLSLNHALNGNMHDNHKCIEGQNATFNATALLLPSKSYAVSSNVQCSLLGVCVCYISSGCLQAIRSVLAVSSAVGQNDLEYV